MAVRPKMLFLTGGVHYPPTSGFSRRVYNLLRIYCDVFDVVLVSDEYAAFDERAMRDHFSALVVDFELLRSSNEGIERGWQRHRYPWLPIQAAEIKSPPLSRSVQRMVAKHGPFDFVHVERLMMTEIAKPLLRRPNGAKLILDLDDWESKARLRQHRANPEPRLLARLKRAVEPIRLRAYEMRCLPKFDHVYVCSRDDQQELSETLSLQNVLVVPNGYDLPQLADADTSGDRQPKVILYIGTLGYGPNLDAVSFFTERIFPEVRRAIPDAEFWIAGDGAPPQILALDHRPGIRVLGYVDDLAELYRSASVVVVPLLSGGGTRVKIVEAAAYRKAIVSTTIGAEGLDFVSSENIVLRDDPHAFARSCVELLNDDDARRRLAEAAREHVEQRFTWTDIGERLIRALTR